MPANTATSDRLFLFHGTDESKAKEAALKLSQKIAPQDVEFGLEIINGSSENSFHATKILAQTTEAIQTLPFFGGDKLVWLQGANFFGDSVTGKSEQTQQSVEAFVEMLKRGIPDDVKIIITATEVDKRRTFYKQISKIAKIEIFDKIDTTKDGWETKVMSWAQKEVQRLGLNFGHGALERFILTAGADTRLLLNELEKLSLFFGEGEISTDAISHLVTKTHAGVIFEIGDALSQRDMPRTLRLIETQLRNGEGAVGIMRAAIIPKVRSMLHSKDLIARHNLNVGNNYRAFESKLNALPPDQTAHLSRKKEGGINAYPIFLSAQAARNFSIPELVNALEACLEADLRLVTTQLDEHLVLCQLVTRILVKK